jgi:REP element-mobilizing transposase RayT
MVEHWWHELNCKFPTVATDAFVVMPDHFHGIVVITAPGDDGDAGGYANPPTRMDIDERLDTDERMHTDDVSMCIDERMDVDESAMGIADSNDHTSVWADLHIRPPRPPIDRGDVASSPRPPRTLAEIGDGMADHAVSLSHVVQWFKIMTTTDYIRQVKHAGWPPFERRIWQRGYYERIIRDERALEAVRRYIAANPARWETQRDSLDALLSRMQRKEA